MRSRPACGVVQAYGSAPRGDLCRDGQAADARAKDCDINHLRPRTDGNDAPGHDLSRWLDDPPH